LVILISQNKSLVASNNGLRMPHGMASSTVENYLKHILLLAEGSSDLVSMGALAESIAVVPGTATTMVKALANDGLVEHQPRQGVRLTESGRQLALGVIRRHRLLGGGDFSGQRFENGLGRRS